jgi:hypothetical protein
MQATKPDDEWMMSVVQKTFVRLSQRPGIDDLLACLGKERRPIAIFFGAAFNKVSCLMGEFIDANTDAQGRLSLWAQELVLDEIEIELLSALHSLNVGRNPYSGTEYEQVATECTVEISGTFL